MNASQPIRRILGVDPGLNVSGYGVVEVRGDRLLVADAGVIRTGSDRSLQARLAEIHEGISEVFANWSPTEMAVEELYAHYERPRTAILMGHARGVLCLAAAQNQVPLLHYSATRIKSLLTGTVGRLKHKCNWRCRIIWG